MGTQWASQVVQGGPVRVIRALRRDPALHVAAGRPKGRPTASLKSFRTGIICLFHFVPGNLEVSEVAYYDTRGHGQFKATRPERKVKVVALMP